MISPKHLHILQHSLGVDQYGRGTMYRNHFVTDVGCDDWLPCVEMMHAGLMETVEMNREMTGGATTFRVTADGIAIVLEQSPEPPKLTRSKRRYQDFLAYDGSVTFSEYIRGMR